MKMRVLVIVLALMLLGSACASAEEVTPEVVIVTATPQPEPEFEEIWVENFENLENWKLDIDASVGCKGNMATSDDLDFWIATKFSSPSDEYSVLQIEANTYGREKVFMNGIAHRKIEYPQKASYLLTGYLRIPADSEAEFANIAFNFVDDEVGYSAEIFWGINPSNGQYYGFVNVRNADYVHVNLGEVPRDTSWHYFELEVTVDSENGVYTIDRMVFDDYEEELGWPIATFEKPGWPRIAQVYIEQHNMYTGCDYPISTIGTSQWDLLTLSRAPLE